jgi:2-dehydro-3-deoxy-D-gluconate 5-dehydrogenase
MFSLDQFSLAGKNALVTGGATGIGAAIASGLAHAGADVAITWHTSAADDTLVAVDVAGKKSAALKCDLGALDTAGARDLVAKTIAAIGGLDILINNAGIIRRAPAVEHSEADWRAAMQTNVDAAFLLSQAAALHMLTVGGGKIVQVASVLGYSGGLTVPGYAASKHALVGLTQSLANEWASKGINVNAIAPGYTATANTAPLRKDEARMKTLLDRIPAGRFAEPEEMAGAVVFLCSPAASYVHGTVLAVDGGWLAR